MTKKSVQNSPAGDNQWTSGVTNMGKFAVLIFSPVEKHSKNLEKLWLQKPEIEATLF